MRVRQGMLSNIPVVTPATPISDGIQLAKDHEAAYLPIVENDTVIGIVPERELRAYDGESRGNGGTATRTTNGAATIADLVLPSQIPAITEDTDMEEAARLMSTHHLECLPVLRDRKVVGVITQKRVLEALLESRRENKDGQVDDLKVGGRGESGTTVSHIFGKTRRVRVYKDSSNRIHIERRTDDLRRADRVAYDSYEGLRARVEGSLPAQQRQQYVDALARAIFLALSAGDDEEPVDHFAHVEREVLDRIGGQSRVRFVLASSALAALAVIVGLVMFTTGTSPDVGLFSVAIASGAAGAWTSIVQRAGKIQLAPYESPSNIMIEGSIRIVLGILFGVVAILALRGNILLSIAGSNVNLIALLAFVAGFGERVVPALLKRIEA